MKLHRFARKASLLPRDGQAPPCPLCIVLGRQPVGKATHLHELWVPPHRGSKYALEYQQVWVVLLCEHCNLFEANAHKRELMQIQVVFYGREVMEAAIAEARALCKTKWAVPTLE